MQVKNPRIRKELLFTQKNGIFAAKRKENRFLSKDHSSNIFLCF